MSGGGSQTSNSVSQFSPPSYTQQPWQNLVSNASALDASGMPVYTGQTVAPISQQQQIGTGMLTSLATQGSPLYDTAQTSLQGMLNGNAVNPYATVANPYMGDNANIDQLVNESNQQLSQNYASGTAAQTDAAAAREGAYGGSGEEEAQTRNAEGLASQINQNTNSLLGQNYYNSANLAEDALNRATGSVQNTQGMQLQAAALAPQYQASDLNAINAMNTAGQGVQSYQQNLLNAGQQLFSQYQQAPWTLSDLMGNVLSRASGSGGTSSSSLYQPMSIGQGLLGAGLGGAGIYSMLNGTTS